MLLAAFISGLGLVKLGSSRLLYVCVVQEPLSEEVDWVLWISLVEDGHALRNDESDFFTLKIVGSGCQLLLFFLV